MVSSLQGGLGKQDNSVQNVIRGCLHTRSQWFIVYEEKGMTVQQTSCVSIFLFFFEIKNKVTSAYRLLIYI